MSKSKQRTPEQQAALDAAKEAQARKLEEQRRKLAEGTTKPLPMVTKPKNEEEAKVEAKVDELAKKKTAEDEEAKKRRLAEIEEIKAELAKKRAMLEALEHPEAAAKRKQRQEQEAAAKARAEEIAKAQAVADEVKTRLDEAEKALAEIPEFQSYKTLLEEHKAAVAAIPQPLTFKKVGGSTTRRKSATSQSTVEGLNGSELRAMRAIAAADHAMSRKELAEATGQEKGWSHLLGNAEGGGLVGKGMVNLVQHEDEPMRYSLTDAGRTAVEKIQ